MIGSNYKKTSTGTLVLARIHMGTLVDIYEYNGTPYEQISRGLPHSIRILAVEYPTE